MAASRLCGYCGNRIFPSSRTCPTCDEDVGFPNVRYTEDSEETDALRKRLETAEASALAGGYTSILDLFASEVSAKSQAIVARSLSMITDLIESDAKLYTTFQMQLAADARLPEDNEFDRVRTQFEAAISPLFHEHIRYAALTLDGRWLKHFGAYAMVLKEPIIERRATVFEENPYVFVQRHGMLVTDRCPPGFRAVWKRRGDLAKAKLYARLNKGTLPNEFPEILMPDRVGSAPNDYIEVHIYGKFNRAAIERVIGPAPRSKVDKLLWRRLTNTLKAAGIALEEVT